MRFRSVRFTIISISMFLLLSVITNAVYSQQILETVKGKQIGKIDETLFYIKNGEKTDRIIKDEIIIRHKNRANLKNFDFNELGLNPFNFVVKDYIEDFYIIKITADENYLGIAKKLELSGLFDTVDFNPTDQNYLNGSWSYPQNLELHKAWDITTGDPPSSLG